MEKMESIRLRTLFNLHLFLIGFTTELKALDIRLCNSPLGMESGEIADSAITASSSYVTNVGARNGRLRKETAGGAWCPKRQIESGIREWLQVDLDLPHVITGIQTQGRYDHGRGQEYVEEYTIEYRRPTFSEWKQYERWNSEKVLPGNSDTSTIVSHELLPPIFATQIRILPHSIHRRTVCLRIELKGCQDRSGIMSYTIPDSPVPELSDVSYDGTRVDGLLTNGLGRLVDGITGADNYRLDIGYGRGTGWIAWMRDSFEDNLVELIFEFDTLRTFDSLHVYTNNYFSRDIQVFAKAEIWFSPDGETYEETPVSYSYIPDLLLENARNVSISLHARQGKTVKIQLYFAARWIMIGEVTFQGPNPCENATEMTTTDFGNVTSNPEVDLDLRTIAAREEDQEYLEVLIGVLTAIILLLLLVFFVILLLSRRQKLQNSPTVLKNPFGFAINMKGFLLNLTPGGMLNDSANRVSPDVQEDGSVHESLTMEQFDSPLVSSRSRAAYAVVSTSDEYSRVTDLSSPGRKYIGSPKETTRSRELCEKTEQEAGTEVTNSITTNTSINSTATTNTNTNTNTNININANANNSSAAIPARSKSPSESPGRRHYRTLQSYNTANAKPMNTSSRRRDVEQVHPTRWHTAPKEKHKVLAPVVNWNIAPSMNRPYKCKEVEPTIIPHHCLRTAERLGSSHNGEAIVCETVGLDDMARDSGRLVVARVPNVEIRSGDELREVGFLSYLSDPNIARILGICNMEPVPWTIMEYTELGDLAHYLQYSVPLTGTFAATNCNLKALSRSCLLYMGTQIASAMRYLESKNLVHKDLAARNCLVGRCYTVKVTDIAMCTDLYRKDYSDIGGRPPAPIRWLPWESILLDRYTCASTVWSFAVTLWEVMSLAREKPFQHLSNEQVIQNAELMYYGNELQVLLPKPTMCPEDVYRMMCSCWRREESSRPSFKDIYTFLKNLIADYRPST